MALVDLKTNLADWAGTKKPSDANPAPVNFMNAGGVDTSTGARGFTKNAGQNPTVSQFLGFNRLGTTYTYPSTVRGGRLMKPTYSPTFPDPVNFIDDTNAGAKGFTLYASRNPFNTQFLGVRFAPNANNLLFNYPMTVRGGRLMKPTYSPSFPGPVNFMNDANSGAKGFKLRVGDNPSESQFLGINTTRSTYTYPNSVRGGRLMQPLRSAAFPGPVNYMLNAQSGAEGFTLNMGRNPLESKFLGINRSQTTYDYPISVRGGRLLAGFPGPTNFMNNEYSGANGFTLNMERTQFLGADTNTSTYIYPDTVRGGRLLAGFPGPVNFMLDEYSGAEGFVLNMYRTHFLGVDTDALTYTYPVTVRGGRLKAGYPGPVNFMNDVYSGANGFTLNQQRTDFIGADTDALTYTYPDTVLGGRLLAGFPGPVNFMLDDYSGANGFTLNMYRTQFLGADTDTGTYTYPDTVRGGRLLAGFPGPVDFLSDIVNGAAGFTTYMGTTQFLGMDMDNLTYTYPDTVRGGRLKAGFPGPVNFFPGCQDDRLVGAKGFTLNMPPKSQFLGITGENDTAFYVYPDTVLPVHRSGVNKVPTKNSKFDQGIATFKAPIGTGSPFYYIKNGSAATKTFSTGYYSSPGNFYSKLVQSVAGQPEKSLLYLRATEQNSPSALEEEYKKYDLREESFNPYYIKQPYVLRGIQRKEKKDPQRWGVVLLDDGFIRGGIVTVGDRVAADLQRIGKWIGSPKGLLWVTKQVGLGFSNPKVETLKPFDTGIAQTKIHTGVTSLLSVAGTAFGLHFTRHSLPFLNEAAKYENVQNAKRLAYKTIGSESLYPNRLLRLRKELQVGTIGFNEWDAGTATATLEKQPILSLSGFGGPNSTYGIGITSIRRYVKSPNAYEILKLESLPIFGSPLDLHKWKWDQPYFEWGKGYQSATNSRIGLNEFKEIYPSDQVKPNNNLSTFYNPLTNFAPISVKVKLRQAQLYAGLNQTNTTGQKFEGLLLNFVTYTSNPRKDASSKLETNFPKPGQAKLETTTKDDGVTSDRISKSFFPKKQYASTLKGKTSHTNNNSIDEAKNDISKLESTDPNEQAKSGYKGLKAQLDSRIKDNASNTDTYPLSTYTPGANRGQDIGNVQLENSKVRDDSGYKNNTTTILHPYASLAYSQIPKDITTKNALNKDFRNAIQAQNSFSSQKQLGISDKLKDYYNNNDLETKKGFGAPGKLSRDRSNPNKFLVAGKDYGIVKPNSLVTAMGFEGDSITALDIIRDRSGNIIDQIYGQTDGANAKDLINFYFKDGDSVDGQIMAFRATLTSFNDTFTPSWTRIDIMGRPDGAYMYDSFERSISFTFTVTAMSRSEMIPMWRKLNFLASYTMPDFNRGSKPSGPFMRLTIGDLFHECPGFIESLSYTIPDEMPWDIGEEDTDNPGESKQLPMGIEVSVTYKVVHDFRPDVMGPVYYLFPRGNTSPISQTATGNWLRMSSQKASLNTVGAPLYTGAGVVSGPVSIPPP